MKYLFDDAEKVWAICIFLLLAIVAFPISQCSLSHTKVSAFSQCVRDTDNPVECQQAVSNITKEE